MHSQIFDFLQFHYRGKFAPILDYNTRKRGVRMKVIVDIPDEKYKVIKSETYYTFPKEMKEWGLEAIRNGTQLPKGHERSINNG